MNIIAIIPARMGSSRFPGKPMALINGMPMIGHVWNRAKMNQKLSDVYVATCDKEIFDYIVSIGGKAIMTKDTHERCTERTSEALEIIKAQTGKVVDIVVMIQGDEPLLFPEMIDEAIEPFFKDKNVNVTNLFALIDSIEDFENPNEVKVVIDINKNALYFSREPIPSRKKWKKNIPMYKQVCVIPFRAEYLQHFNLTPPTILEKIESVDMMRILESGGKVYMVETKYKTYSVDTVDDLNWVEKVMNEDAIFPLYSSKKDKLL